MKTPAQDQPTIIIPCCEWNEWVIDCLRACTQLDHQDFEVWVLPHDPPSSDWERKISALGLDQKLRIEPTGPANPATKRNIAMQKSTTPIMALIDSDAYPRPDWLTQGLSLLTGKVGAVTGPNITPPNDPVMRRAPGHVMESPLGFGAGYFRHTPKPRKIVQEMPTCNMILRKEPGLLFREDFDTSEDMAYCADLRALNKQVIYDPLVIVFHHRRSLFLPFAQQFFCYGLDKGRTAKEGHDFTYFYHACPALFVLYTLFVLFLSFFPLPPLWRSMMLFPLLVYVLAITFESIRRIRTLKEFALTWIAFVVAHVSYGTGYVKGYVEKMFR